MENHDKKSNGLRNYLLCQNIIISTSISRFISIHGMLGLVIEHYQMQLHGKGNNLSIGLIGFQNDKGSHLPQAYEQFAPFLVAC